MAEKGKKERFIFDGKATPLQSREVDISDKLKEIYKNFLKQKVQQTLKQTLTSIGMRDESGLKIKEEFKKAKRQALENFFKLGNPGYTVIDFHNLYDFLLSIRLDHPFKKTGDAIKYLLPYFVSEELKVMWDLPIFVRNIPDKMTNSVRLFLESNDGDIVILKGFVNSITYIDNLPVYFVVRHSLCGGTFMVENDIPYKKGLKNILELKVKHCPLCGSSEGHFIVENVITTEAYKLVISDIPKEEGKETMTIDAFVIGKAIDVYKISNTKVNLIGIVRRVFDGKEVKSYVEVIGIEPTERLIDEVEVSEDDKRQIQEVVKESGYKIIDWMAESMFHNIKGEQYKYVKRAVLLQAISIPSSKDIDLLTERSYINILLLGDPGTGKSTLLRTVSKLIPRSRYVVSTSLTKAGLLGTVTKSEEGKWVLEIGALPSAAGGILCIDEINMLSSDDIKTLNEAMEHGTATIDKAGVHVTLKANAAVLAASNPKYGRWDPNRELISQINIDPTMLSRFDLIFILRDVPNKEQDILEAKELLRKDKVENAYFSKDFVLKYIAYARSIKPELSEEAETYIAKLYADTRDRTKDQFPITKRQLGTIKRLAIAVAKARLSYVVTKEDVDYAWEIISNSIYSIVGNNATVLDFGVVETGVKSSTKSRLQLLKEVIWQLNKTYGKGVTFNDIYNYLKDKYGLDLSQTELKDLITLLKTNGDIYEPEPGLYSVLY